jgi:hypothetical protein
LPGDAHSIEPGTSPLAYVLLVGDAPSAYEQLDVTRLIPTAIHLEKSRPSRQRLFATDNLYALPGPRGQPRLAVGRWPVRSAQEVAVQVQKTLSYENRQEPGLHRRDVTFIATTPNYDPLLDPILEGMAMSMINGQIKPHWGVRAMYSSPTSSYFPGPLETQRQVIRWLEDATPITLFAGHGFDRGVDVVRFEGRQYPVLDVDIANQLRGGRPGTVLWMSACSCGAFDLPPPHRGLAEALMMNPNGPTAVIAGTEETSAYANLLLCLGLAQDVIEKNPATLGEALLRFKRAAFKPAAPLLKNMLLSLEPTEKPELLPEDHQFLYNLLGDPTLSLNLPSKIAISADVTETHANNSDDRTFLVSGKLDNWNQGTAWVSLLIDRIQLKKSERNPATIEALADRPAAYLERFHMANDKTVAKAQVQVTDGRFTVELSIAEQFVSKVRWLQVYVRSDPVNDEDWRDGVSAQSIRLGEVHSQ